MTQRILAAAAAVLLWGMAGTAYGQTATPAAVAQAGGRPAEEVARLYDSLSARPGWPTTASEAAVDAMLTRRGLRAEQRRLIISGLKQDVCRVPDMVPVCRYYGAETIYKVQRLSWTPEAIASAATMGASREGTASPDLALRLQLLEYGASRNLLRLSDKGLSDEQEGLLNFAASAKKWFSIHTSFSAWFGCSTDMASLPGSGLWTRYKLTTCGTGFGFAMWVVIFNWQWAFEADLLLTHSRFARNVIVWWPTGSEPTICADSVINGSGNQQCHNNNWYSPISFKFATTGNPLSSVVSHGTAARMSHAFSVTIVHQ